MKKYEIVLQNKKQEIYPLISWLIIALNCLCFIFVGIANFAKPIYPFTAAALLGLVFLIHFIYKDRIKNGNTAFTVCFIIVLLTWLIIGFYPAAGINLLLFFFQDSTHRRFLIQVGRDNIIFPSFPKKIIQWNQLNNVVLKDDLLTIDFKNNRIIQQLVDKTEDPVNEKEFNDFCSQRLADSLTF